MAEYDLIHITPNFRQTQLPCVGKAGDLVILSPLAEDDWDSSNQGRASLWLCIKSSLEEKNVSAVWARVQFDGVATCDYPIPEPPQDRPNLSEG